MPVTHRLGQRHADEPSGDGERRRIRQRDAVRTALQSAVAVRVIEGFSSEGAKGVTMFGLTMHEGACILGEAPVYADGSWLANVPPYIPMHLQPIDKFGMSIRSQGLWIQGMPGEDRRCVGCHEQRTGQGVTAPGERQTVADQNGPQNLMIPVADPRAGRRVRLGTRVQPILTAQCAELPQRVDERQPTTQTYYTRTDPVTGKGTTYNIPYLDLSDTPVTAFYDRKSAYTYPASYVSIFYPAAMMMNMDTKVTGKVPPMWGVPASARSSALIEKINVQAPDGTTAWPLATHPMHPEDVGVTLTDDERRMLILTDGSRRSVPRAAEHRLRGRPREQRSDRADLDDARHGGEVMNRTASTRQLILAAPSVAFGAVTVGADAKSDPSTRQDGGGTAAVYGNFRARPGRVPLDARRTSRASSPAARRSRSGRHSSTASASSVSTASAPSNRSSTTPNPKNREIAAWWLRRRIFGVFGPGETYERTVNTLASDPDPMKRSYAAPTRSASSSCRARNRPACATALRRRLDPDGPRRGRLGARAAQRRRPRRERRAHRRPSPTRTRTSVSPALTAAGRVSTITDAAFEPAVETPRRLETPLVRRRGVMLLDEMRAKDAVAAMIDRSPSRTPTRTSGSPPATPSARSATRRRPHAHSTSRRTTRAASSATMATIALRRL